MVLGLAALFLGGILGGLLGTTLRGEPPRPGADATPQGAVPERELESGELAVALADLTREVQRLWAALDAQASRDTRTGVPGGAPAEDGSERLVAALESLGRALSSGRRPGSGPGEQAAPLFLPTGSPRRDLISDLRAIEDDEERSRVHRFLTYQQVLDRFGVPDQVYPGGQWVYEDPATQRETYFRFDDGLLIRID